MPISDDDDDDDNVRLALATSMGQTDPSTSGSMSRPQATIDLTSDDEDEDLRQAIALSLHESKSDQMSSSGKPAHNPLPLESSKPITDVPSSVNPLGIPGLNRKAMEEERLARSGKRKKRDLPPEPSCKRQERSPGEPAAESSHSTSSIATLKYPTGTIKRTYASGYPRSDDITIDEVFEADSVKIAVISSFQWDSDWLHKKLDPRKVKQIWIMNAKGADVQRRWRQEMADCNVPNLKIHFPPMNGLISSMHSKLMLLFGADKLRVVVPTANMIQTDWGEVNNNWQPGVFENSVFLVDLPRRQNGSATDRKGLTSFGRELVVFLEAMNIEQIVINNILRFEFEDTRHLEFIHAIGGSHQAGSSNTGLSGLAGALRRQNLHDVEHIELDYVSSSLGAINDAFLERIWLAVRGEQRSSATAGNIRKHIRVYFPMEETVKKSTGGPNCGGIISLFQNHYDAASFPKDCLRDHDSTRSGMLSHSKMLLARGRFKNGKPFAWVYTGSANMSESAWGSQRMLKSGQLGTLSIRNWECGVLLPVSVGHHHDLKMTDETPPMKIFKDTIEIPFVFPGKEYGDSKPWFRKAFGH